MNLFKKAIVRFKRRFLFSWQSRRAHKLSGIISAAKANPKYVAYLDILGFANLTLTDFDATVDTYVRAFQRSGEANRFYPNADIQVYSDTVVVTADELRSCIGTVQMINHILLFNDYLVRGGIAYGLHKAVTYKNNTFVVSEALTKAARLEKTIKHPCIAIDDSVKIPLEWWIPHQNPFARPLLHFDGINIVSPFLIIWGQSAKTRVFFMKKEHPEYSDKYDWFLRLYDACYNNEILISDDVRAQLVRSASRALD